ncbi:MAG: MFS transporter [Nocardioides sp.]
MTSRGAQRPVVDGVEPVVWRARNAVGLSFFLNGFCLATWVSRIPQARVDLGLSNSGLGLLLLCIAVGSLLAMPSTGGAIRRWGTVPVVQAAGIVAAVGLTIAGVGVSTVGAVAVAGAGLFIYGVGTGVWDIAMNVEGADVERRLRRTVMPRFHAGFSLGTVAGAGLGAALVRAEVPLVVHLAVVAAGSLALIARTARHFLPGSPVVGGPAHSSLAAWREPRTLAIGLMVLALAITEGTANDWLAVALVDGYQVTQWGAVLGFALFVTAMTAGRLGGHVVLDAFGRSAVLWATMVLAGSGIILIVFGDRLLIVGLGIACWGVGASLGFPVGMSAAAADPTHAAARVSVVSTIGYAAFLAGPPLLGFVGDQVGTLHALLVVVGLLIPAMLLVPAAGRD